MRPEDNAFLRQIIYGSWGLVALRGIVLTVLGVFLVTNPGATIRLIAQLLGAFLAIEGALVALLALKSRRQSDLWKADLARGVLVFVVGILVIALPAGFVTAAGLILIFLAAAALVANGITGIIRAVRIRDLIEDEWSMIAGGVLQVVMGIILALAPAFFGTLFLVILGILTTIGGVALVIVAVRMRRLSRSAE